jgi:hypothetical protein
LEIKLLFVKIKSFQLVKFPPIIYFVKKMFGKKLQRILEKQNTNKSPVVRNYWKLYKNSTIEEKKIEIFPKLFFFITQRTSYLSEEMIKLHLILWLITFEIIEDMNYSQSEKEKYLNQLKLETKKFLDNFQNPPSVWLKFFISNTGNTSAVVQNSMVNFALSLISMTFIKKNRLFIGGVVFFILNSIQSSVFFLRIK